MNSILFLSCKITGSLVCGEYFAVLSLQMILLMDLFMQKMK